MLKVTFGALVMMKGKKQGNLYFLQSSTMTGNASVSMEASGASTSSDSIKLQHMRLEHVREKAIIVLCKQGLLKDKKSYKLEFCKQYVLEKQMGVKFGMAIHCMKGLLDYIRTDVWGPSKMKFLGSNYYFVTFIDDFFGRIWIFHMKYKDEVFGVFIKWKKMVENQLGRKVNVLRSDNGEQ